MNVEIIDSIYKKPRPQPRRFTILLIALGCICIFIAGRGFFLQVVHGENFHREAERNRVNQILIPAPRGIIYDRHGKQLVENVSSTDLLLHPALLPTEENEAYLVENISQLLPELTPEAVRAALIQVRTTQRPYVLAKALSHDQVLSLEEAAEKIRGTQLTSSLVRKYPHGPVLSHVLGYTNSVTQQELDEDDSLYPTDTTGKQGLERMYDEHLRGIHGVAQIEVNASGRPQTDLGRLEPVPGEDIQVTVDLEFQQFIYALFSERDSKKFKETGEHVSGAVVVMDPFSGDVLALVSYPAFDTNIFSQPALQTQASKAFEDPATPLFNRGVDGSYASGSVIKPFIAAAALEEKIISPETTILSTGGISIGPWNFPDWKAGGHGTTDVFKAIAESVNTFFYAITGGYEEQRGLGVEKTTDYLRRFGWAEKTGIDLPSEEKGFLPSPAWKKEVKKESWYIGDTYHLGIGQGDVLVTPLQVAASTSIIANGGDKVTPQLVHSDSHTNQIDISRESIETVRQAMRHTVTEGSGRALAELPIAIAGKTGTAQIGGTDKTHAWFTSFGPFEKPEIVVTVLLEKGGEGDKEAVPFAKEIWQWWIENERKIPTSDN